MALGDGIGQKILVKIFQHFQIKKLDDLGKITKPTLVLIDGIEEKTASKILHGIPKIQKFMMEHSFLKFIPIIIPLLLKKVSCKVKILF